MGARCAPLDLGGAAAGPEITREWASIEAGERLSGRHALGRTLYGRGRLMRQELLGVIPPGDGFSLSIRVMAAHCN
jgi:hypothetical protein